MSFEVGDIVYIHDEGHEGNYRGTAKFLEAKGEWVIVEILEDHQGSAFLAGDRTHFADRRVCTRPPAPEPVFDWGERRRFRDEATGYEKDTSVYRFDLIPADALAELAKVYGVGEEKYPSGPEGPNWMQGAPFWPSRAALSRHLASYDLGEDVDPSDGTYHLAKIAWHAFALLVYGPLRGTGTDTRGSLKRRL